jgi:MFS family permease
MSEATLNIASRSAWLFICVFSQKGVGKELHPIPEGICTPQKLNSPQKAREGEHGVTLKPDVLPRQTKLLIAASFLSSTGTWLSFIAVPVVIIGTTNQKVRWLASYWIVISLTMMVCSFTGGVIADKFQPQKVVLVTQATIIASSSVICYMVATGPPNLPALLAVQALNATTNAVYKPAQTKLFIGLIDVKATQARAIAANATALNLSMVIGPLTAGLALSEGIKPVWLFLADTATYLPLIAVFAGLSRTTISEVQQKTPAKNNPNLSETLRYVWRNKTLRLVFFVSTVVHMLSYNLNVTGPLIASDVFHIQGGYGLLLNAEGIGFVLSLSLIAWSKKPHPHRVLRPGLNQMIYWGILTSLFFIGYGSSPWFPLTLAFMVLASFAGGPYNNSVDALTQTTPKETMRGRVIGFQAALAWFGGALGKLLTLGLISLCGISLAISIEATTAIGILLAVQGLQHRARK